ncbi:hypothetical protein [Zooshikella ganghwensis]|uniref:Uncharacterized protein n=1 Tax=Zooshikella ganghwensis TaxID=202772 RepID=A0A4V1INE0_9GAMM|nr:hypothetical protein [Zooshikella ganghwensis]RDH43401.1 hypothetical protein B9G39_08090 [Zooshikella ganghwensis]
MEQYNAIKRKSDQWYTREKELIDIAKENMPDNVFINFSNIVNALTVWMDNFTKKIESSDIPNHYKKRINTNASSLEYLMKWEYIVMQIKPSFLIWPLCFGKHPQALIQLSSSTIEEFANHQAAGLNEGLSMLYLDSFGDRVFPYLQKGLSIMYTQYHNLLVKCHINSIILEFIIDIFQHFLSILLSIITIPFHKKRTKYQLIYHFYHWISLFAGYHFSKPAKLHEEFNSHYLDITQYSLSMYLLSFKK